MVYEENIYKYKVEAVEYGWGYNKYEIQFEFTSIYDIDKDEDKVMRQVRGKVGVKTGGRGFKIVSVEKI